MANVVDDIDELSLESTKLEALPDFKSGRIKTGIGLYWAKEVKVPAYWTPLCRIQGSESKALPIEIHNFVKLKVGVDNEGKDVYKFFTKVCLKSKIMGSQDDCPWCKVKDAFDPKKEKTNRAKSMLVFPVYMFSKVGQVDSFEITEKGGKTKKIERPSNPVTFLALSRGQEDSNIANLIEHDLNDAFMGELYSSQKYPKTDKKAMDAETASMKIVAKKFQHLPDGLTVPQQILEDWSTKTRKQVRGLAANCYGMFTDDAPETFLRLVEKPEALPDEETSSDEGEADNVAAELDG